MANGSIELDDDFNVDDIKRRAKYIRERILDEAEVDLNDTAPSILNYKIFNNSIGLNEVSNVDMGYAGYKIADQTLSKRQPYLNELEYNVGLMKESKNSILLLNGGLFTCIPKKGRGSLLSYKDQIAYFYDLFKDLAQDGKIVAMVRGTEEHKILRDQGIDVLGILQEALGLSGKVANDVLVNVELEDDIVENAKVGIRTINWNNTASTTSYLGRKMVERATKRGGADIYIARSTRNFYKTAVMGGLNEDGKIEKKTIYLVSPGPYTPFKGAKAAGAEYNSIKDGELAPNSFWYRVTVEPRKDDMPGRPYIVRVNPIEYTAHQVLDYSTDKTTESIKNLVTAQTENCVRYFLDQYAKTAASSREEKVNDLREVLNRNKAVASHNDEIRAYNAMKSGKVSHEDDKMIEDLGSNIDIANAAPTEDSEEEMEM